MLFSGISIDAFAAEQKINCAGYSGTIYNAEVTIPKGLTKKEVITVVNDGKVNVDVYIGGIFRCTLSPGKSYSIHYRSLIYGGMKISVKIQTRNTYFGKTYVKIQTSSKNNIRLK